MSWKLLNEAEKEKNKTCVFEIVDHKTMEKAKCGKVAYGKKGDTLRTCLCKEHFYYTSNLGDLK